MSSVDTCYLPTGPFHSYLLVRYSLWGLEVRLFFAQDIVLDVISAYTYIGLSAAIIISAFWSFSFLVNLIIPFILGSPEGFFYIVAGVNLLSIFLIAFALPETKVLHHGYRNCCACMYILLYGKASLIWTPPSDMEIPDQSHAISTLKILWICHDR